MVFCKAKRVENLARKMIRVKLRLMFNMLRTIAMKMFGVDSPKWNNFRKSRNEPNNKMTLRLTWSSKSVPGSPSLDGTQMAATARRSPKKN